MMLVAYRESRRVEPSEGENGMVTGELAIGFLCVGVVVALVTMLASIGIQYAAAHEAARSAVRVAALGGQRESIIKAARESLPGAETTVVEDERYVTVVVRADSRFGMTVEAEATTIREPDDV